MIDHLKERERFDHSGGALWFEKWKGLKQKQSEIVPGLQGG